MNFENFMNSEFAKKAMAQYAVELYSLYVNNFENKEEIIFKSTTKIYRDINDNLKTSINIDRKNITYTFREVKEKITELPIMSNSEILALPVVKIEKVMNLEVCDFHMPKLEKVFDILNYTTEIIKSHKIKKFNIRLRNIKKINIVRQNKEEKNIDFKEEDKKEFYEDFEKYFHHEKYHNLFYVNYSKNILSLIESCNKVEIKNLPSYFKQDYKALKKSLNEHYITMNNTYYMFIKNLWFENIEKYFVIEKEKKEESKIENIITIQKNNEMDDYELCF